MIVYGSVANAVVEYYRVVRAAVPLYIQKLKPTNDCSMDYLLSAREAIPLRKYCGLCPKKLFDLPRVFSVKSPSSDIYASRTFSRTVISLLLLLYFVMLQPVTSGVSIVQGVPHEVGNNNEKLFPLPCPAGQLMIANPYFTSSLRPNVIPAPAPCCYRRHRF